MRKELKNYIEISSNAISEIFVYDIYIYLSRNILLYTIRSYIDDCY